MLLSDFALVFVHSVVLCPSGRFKYHFEQPSLFYFKSLFLSNLWTFSKMTSDKSGSINGLRKSFISSLPYSKRVLSSQPSLSWTLWKTTNLSPRLAFYFLSIVWKVVFCLTTSDHSGFLLCSHSSTLTEVAISVTFHTLLDPGWLTMTWIVRLLLHDRNWFNMNINFSRSFPHREKLQPYK